MTPGAVSPIDPTAPVGSTGAEDGEKEQACQPGKGRNV
jgi:hypothetical protein